MIFYYTATGNTLAVVKQLQEELGKEMAGELLSMTDCLKENKYDFTLAEGEVVGFAVPVYFFGIPASVWSFLEQVALTGAKPKAVLLISTCGGSAGGVNEMMEKILLQRGIQADYKLCVKFLSNYTVMYTIPPAEEQRQKQEAAERMVREFAQAIKAGQTGDFNPYKGPISSVTTPIGYSFYSRSGMKTNKFQVESSCTGCGLCQKLCPVSAIQMEAGRPVWQKERCDRCLACYHRCPVNAIQVGKSKGKGQYLHPVMKQK